MTEPHSPDNQNPTEIGEVRKKLSISLKGLPLDIFQPDIEKEWLGEISHRYLLECKTTKKQHLVYSNEAPDIYCSAEMLTGDKLFFVCSNKGFAKYRHAYDPETDAKARNRHPDLFARNTAILQYKYLLDQGNKIEFLIASWTEIGKARDNYDSFASYYKAETGKDLQALVSPPSNAIDLTNDPVASEAAMQTWTGQLAQQIGFGEIIKIFYVKGDGLSVDFKKTEDVDIVIDNTPWDG